MKGNTRMDQMMDGRLIRMESMMDDILRKVEVIVHQIRYLKI